MGETRRNGQSLKAVRMVGLKATRRYQVFFFVFLDLFQAPSETSPVRDLFVQQRLFLFPFVFSTKRIHARVEYEALAVFPATRKMAGHGTFVGFAVDRGVDLPAKSALDLIIFDSFDQIIS